MAWKVGKNTVFFILYNYNSASDNAFYCRAKETAEQVLKEFEIEYTSFELSVFKNGFQSLIFASAIEERQCRRMYVFDSSDDLLSAYTMMEQNPKCDLFRYNGKYYAALYSDEVINTLSEYARSVDHVENCYAFLLEHGTCVSHGYLF